MQFGLKHFTIFSTLSGIDTFFFSTTSKFLITIRVAVGATRAILLISSLAKNLLLTLMIPLVPIFRLSRLVPNRIWFSTELRFRMLITWNTLEEGIWSITVPFS